MKMPAASRPWPRRSSSPPTSEASVSYIDQSLVEGETIVHRAHVSWWSQFGLVLLGIVLLVVFGLGLIFLAWAWINVHSTEIAITNRRIIAKFGFVSRRTIEININQVEALRVD